MKRLLIIPAKKNSKRIKSKNIKLFRGKPIIYYSIQAAKKSKLFDKIHISTDSTRIKKICENLGVNTLFFRDKNLTKKNVGLFDVYKSDYLRLLKKNLKFDEIWCLLPCAPLINYLDLVKISKKIRLKKISLPCITVSKFPAPIEWSYSMTKNKKLKPLFFKKHVIPSQKFKKSYFDVGVLSIFKSSHLLFNNKMSINKKFYGYELPWNKAVDIDNFEDWEEAKIKYNLNLNTS